MRGLIKFAACHRRTNWWLRYRTGWHCTSCRAEFFQRAASGRRPNDG